MELFSSERFGKQAWDKQHGQNEIVRAALCYASNGWPVVPLSREGLEHSGTYPRPQNQPNDGLRIYDARSITAFWKAEPNAGLGIATGDDSCIMAVHVSGEGKHHVASLKLPLTWQAEAADSMIYYLRQPRHLLMPGGFLPGACDVLPGIDVHATGSAAIAPPTFHQSGQKYSWTTPEGRPLADCPLSIVAALERKWRP